MNKPNVTKFERFAEITLAKYDRYLPTAFDESLTLLEKMNKLIQYLNEIGLLVGDVVDNWNAVMEWVMNEGLTEAVYDKLDMLVADGTMEELINVHLFNNLKQKIENVETRVFDHGLNVLEYGAVADGETDNTNVFKNVLEIAAQMDLPIFIPKKDKTYKLDNQVVLDSFNDLHILSNGATLEGRGLYLKEGKHLYVEGLKFKGINFLPEKFDEGIRTDKVYQIDLYHNEFDSCVTRFRSNNQAFKNEYVNVKNNYYTGDIRYAGEYNGANALELYGFQNISISDNIFSTKNVHRVLKISGSLDLLEPGEIIRTHGYSDRVMIKNNIFLGSCNKQVIDTFIASDNLNIISNHFEVKNAQMILDTKISGGSTSRIAATMNNVKVSGNNVKVLDTSMNDLFRLFSYRFTTADNGGRTQATFSDNNIENTTTKDIRTVEFRGFSRINANGNTTSSLSTTSSPFFVNFSVIACADIIFSNNSLQNGSFVITSAAGSSNESLAYDKSPENINISNNIINDVRHFGGVYIWGSNGIQSLNINNNIFKARKASETYILSFVYIRNSSVKTININHNNGVFDQATIDRHLLVDVEYEKINIDNNSWNPSTYYDTAIPTTGTYKRGDKVIFTNPSIGGYIGAVCVSSGTPGQWTRFTKILSE